MQSFPRVFALQLVPLLHVSPSSFLSSSAAVHDLLLHSGGCLPSLTTRRAFLPPAVPPAVVGMSEGAQLSHVCCTLSLVGHAEPICHSGQLPFLIPTMCLSRCGCGPGPRDCCAQPIGGFVLRAPDAVNNSVCYLSPSAWLLACCFKVSGKGVNVRAM